MMANPSTSPSGPKPGVALRGLALFFGGFALLNLVGELRATGFDQNLWWLDLRALPAPLAYPLLWLAAATLIAFGVRPPRSVWRMLVTVACAAWLAVIALANSVTFYVLLARGTLQAGVPLPLSLLVAVAMAAIVATLVRSRGLSPNRPALVRTLAICLAAAVAFPLLQMLFFGKTDYRRPADVAVVPGARAYADGRPSDALADRVRTACELYREGLARKLIFSGGPGDGAIHETESMRRMALSLGVKPEDILTDEAGLNTHATVQNTEALFTGLHASRVMVVSHFYHLPRLKMAYSRTGWEVYTVPAHERYLLRQLPYNMLREVAAFWVYYLRPLKG